MKGTWSILTRKETADARLRLYKQITLDGRDVDGCIEALGPQRVIYACMLIQVVDIFFLGDV